MHPISRRHPKLLGPGPASGAARPVSPGRRECGLSAAEAPVGRAWGGNYSPQSKHMMADQPLSFLFAGLHNAALLVRLSAEESVRHGYQSPFLAVRTESRQ